MEFWATDWLFSTTVRLFFSIKKPSFSFGLLLLKVLPRAWPLLQLCNGWWKMMSSSFYSEKVLHLSCTTAPMELREEDGLPPGEISLMSTKWLSSFSGSRDLPGVMEPPTSTSLASRTVAAQLCPWALALCPPHLTSATLREVSRELSTPWWWGPRVYFAFSLASYATPEEQRRSQQLVGTEWLWWSNDNLWRRSSEELLCYMLCPQNE